MCLTLLFCFGLTLGPAMESVAQDRPAQILEIYRDYLKPDAAPANRKLEKRAEYLRRTLGFTLISPSNPFPGLRRCGISTDFNRKPKWRSSGGNTSKTRG